MVVLDLIQKNALKFMKNQQKINIWRDLREKLIEPQNLLFDNVLCKNNPINKKIQFLIIHFVQFVLARKNRMLF